MAFDDPFPKIPEDELDRLESLLADVEYPKITQPGQGSAASIEAFVAQVSREQGDVPPLGQLPVAAQADAHSSPGKSLGSIRDSENDTTESITHESQGAEEARRGVALRQQVSDWVLLYAEGATIREIAEASGRTYGFVHRALQDAMREAHSVLEPESE